MFFLSQVSAEQAHMASALVFELSKVGTAHVREAIVGHLQHIDRRLAQRVADGLGMDALPPAPATAVAAKDLPLSPALQLIGKMQHTLQGRCVGILIADGSDAQTIAKLRAVIEKAGASVKIVAPKLGGAKLADGSSLAADGQLAGTPSVIFDAVALILSSAAGKMLSNEAAAVDFVRDAFGHLKAIAVDAGGRALLSAAGVSADAAVVDAADGKRFADAAATRQWEREAKVRTLA
jgi:catalase